MQSSSEISERAITLGSVADRQGAVDELIRLADGRPALLDRAREELVGRIMLRSNDFDASGGLTLVNAALSQVGWPAESTWLPRKWRLRR